MPALPPSSDFTGAAVTEGQFKTALTSLRGFLADLLGTTGTQAAALAALGALSGSQTSKSSNYTVVAADRGKVIECTATLTLSLTAAATLGGAFPFLVMNSGSGTVTIDPSGSETIDDKATISVAAGKSVLVVCNGAEFYTVGADAGSGWLGGMQVFTSSGTFTVPEGVTKVKVTVVGGGGNGGAQVGGGASGGGGSGGVAIKLVSGLSPGGAVSVTVGAVAGTSSFGSHCSATGGSTGSSPGGGTGGTATGGDVNINGQVGGAGIASTLGGNGASSVVGQGAPYLTTDNPAAGLPARGYGAAGSGARRSGVGTSTGGAGAPGIVIVEW